MFYYVVPTSLTNHSFPTDFLLLTVLVAQSLLKLEPFLLCSTCMFLYFFMDFLNVLLCCSYFFNKPFISHRFLTDNSLSGPIPSEIGTLSSLISLYVSLFFHGFPKCFMCCPYFFNKPFISHRYLTDNSLSGPIPSEIGTLSSVTRLYISLFFSWIS